MVNLCKLYWLNLSILWFSFNRFKLPDLCRQSDFEFLKWKSSVELLYYVVPYLYQPDTCMHTTSLELSLSWFILVMIFTQYAIGHYPPLNLLLFDVYCHCN